MWEAIMRNSKFTVSAVATLSAILGIGAASAADMAVKARPIAEPAPCVWCGFYVGINGGGAFTDDRRVVVTETFLGAPFVSGTFPGFGVFGSRNVSGGFGGAQAGYNWQRERWVFGLEADIQGADIRGTAGATLPYIFAPNTITTAVSERLDWFGTVRGRVGYAWDRFLIYGTGGLAYGQVRTAMVMTDTFAFTAAAADSTTRVGYAVGGGGEYAFTPNWSAKLEYQYINLGSRTLNAVEAGPTPGFAIQNTTRFDYHTVRVGLNYKFGGPIVARY
jgi:outer membrane immunogenic protein